jgi:hypothetical protein
MDEVFWIIAVIVGISAAFLVLRFIERLVIASADVGGEIADSVYNTGDSATHLLLKVIITILFPPLIFLWIWKYLRQPEEPTAREIDEAAQELRLMEEKRIKDKENAKLWRGEV